MGILTTGRVGGQLIGPIIGGMIAGVWDYQMTFYLFGIIMFIAGILALVFVKEEFNPHEVAKNASRKEKSALAQVNSLPIVIAMFITAMLVNAVTKLINPVISLFVQQLLHGHGSVSVVSGIITALPGFATIMAAHRLGDLGDRIGGAQSLGCWIDFLRMRLFRNELGRKCVHLRNLPVLDRNFGCNFTSACSNCSDE